MFRVAKLREDAHIPRRSQAGDAGYDLAAVVDVVVQRGGVTRVPTGIALQIPSDCYARIAPRSGLAAKHGIDVLAGVVDSSYRGEVQVLLINHGSSDFAVKAGDRVAQLIFERIYTPNLVEVEPQALTETERGQGGFGSSGVSVDAEYMLGARSAE